MNLEQLIAEYEPSVETIALIQSTTVVLLVGISGAGKDTIKKQLLDKPDYHDIVSHTTRAPRANNGIAEIADVDYHFIDDATATNMLNEQAFIEAKFVHGTVYGTSAQEVKIAHVEGKIAITDVDVQGVEEYKAISPVVVAIFILPPSYTEWRERLHKRYATTEEFEAEWPKRRASAIDEFTRALEVPYYHFIVNDELEETVRIADEIAHKPDVFLRQDDEARLLARDILEEIIQNN